MTSRISRGVKPQLFVMAIGLASIFVRAANGDTSQDRVTCNGQALVASTITLSCTGQPNRQMTLAVGQLSTIITGWGGTCPNVTISSTNGWDTNFDNLVLK